MEALDHFHILGGEESTSMENFGVCSTKFQSGRVFDKLFGKLLFVFPIEVDSTSVVNVRSTTRACPILPKSVK